MLRATPRVCIYNVRKISCSADHRSEPPRTLSSALRYPLTNACARRDGVRRGGGRGGGFVGWNLDIKRTTTPVDRASSVGLYLKTPALCSFVRTNVHFRSHGQTGPSLLFSALGMFLAPRPPPAAAQRRSIYPWRRKKCGAFFCSVQSSGARKEFS